MPILHKSGRKAKRLADERIELINKTYDEHKIGPLAGKMCMTAWRAGSYTCPAKCLYEHAVVIVGYDDAGGYWIVRNSRGSGFGTDGYFKEKYGNCKLGWGGFVYGVDSP